MSERKVPKLRFAGFTDDWKQRKLGDIGEKFIGGGTPSTNNSDFWNGKIAWIQSSDLTDSSIHNIQIRKKISKKALDNSPAKLINENSIAIVTRVGVGKVALVPFKYATSQDFLSISHLNIDELFASYTISRLMQIESLSTQGTSIKGITKDVLLEKLIFIPPTKAEQQAIGEFFKQLDDTIAFHQREWKKYKNLKISYLEKMFPQENENKPQLRFPNFTDAWKQRKLGEVVFQIKSYSLSRNVETNKDTGFKYVHYGDIHRNIAKLLSSENNLPSIQKGNYEFLQKGDLVIADASEDYEGIGNSCLIDCFLSRNIVAGLHTIALRPTEVNSLFLYYLLHTDIFSQYGKVIATGTKVFGITAKNLLNFEFNLPSEAEQQAIGEFFRQLDDTIAFHQRELEKYKNLKNGYLKQMFV